MSVLDSRTLARNIAVQTIDVDLLPERGHYVAAPKITFA